MYKKILVISAVLLFLTACERQQQGADSVMNKETPMDFTTSPEAQKPTDNQTQTPMLPGKAQILGAPIQDFQTQTGSADVQPSEVQVINKDSETESFDTPPPPSTNSP